MMKKHLRRFAAPQSVDVRLIGEVQGTDHILQKFDNLTKQLGICLLFLICAALCVLGYIDVDDHNNEYFQMSETVVYGVLKSFVRIVVEKFGNIYMDGSPSQNRKYPAMYLMARRGFIDCFVSWDYKKYQYMMRIAGQYKGKSGKQTITIKAICNPYICVCDILLG